jgi:hypothetical protein
MWMDQHVLKAHPSKKVKFIDFSHFPPRKLCKEIHKYMRQQSNTTDAA